MVSGAVEAGKREEKGRATLQGQPGSGKTKWTIFGLSLTGLLLLGGIVYLAKVLADPRMSLIPAPVAQEIQGIRPVYHFSIYGKQDLPLRRPLAASESPNGDIFVVDSGNSLVQVFDHNGKFKATIGKPGGDEAGGGELAFPVGVAFDEEGQIYVTDSRAGHISVFSPGGGFLGYFGEGTAGKVVTNPVGIHYRNGKFYVADLGSHRIVVLDYKGDKVGEVGSGIGNEAGQLQYPNYVCVDGTGQVYVADSNNNRVVVFGPDGEVVRTITGAEFNSSLNLPRGIALDDKGFIHVVSVFNHQVKVFGPDGSLLYAYGNRGENDSEFNFPNGLSIVGKRIYVADRENNRVQVWEY